jgi:hypothetical protein
MMCGTFHGNDQAGEDDHVGHDADRGATLAGSFSLGDNWPLRLTKRKYTLQSWAQIVNKATTDAQKRS